jgi:hypothetical protein
MGFYSPRTLIQEAKSKKVTFLPLHIMYSNWDYTIEPQSSSSKLIDHQNWEFILKSLIFETSITKHQIFLLIQSNSFYFTK